MGSWRRRLGCYPQSWDRANRVELANSKHKFTIKTSVELCFAADQLVMGWMLRWLHSRLDWCWCPAAPPTHGVSTLSTTPPGAVRSSHPHQSPRTSARLSSLLSRGGDFFPPCKVRGVLSFADAIHSCPYNTEEVKLGTVRASPQFL